MFATYNPNIKFASVFDTVEHNWCRSGRVIEVVLSQTSGWADSSLPYYPMWRIRSWSLLVQNQRWIVIIQRRGIHPMLIPQKSIKMSITEICLDIIRALRLQPHYKGVSALISRCIFFSFCQERLVMLTPVASDQPGSHVCWRNIRREYCWQKYRGTFTQHYRIAAFRALLNTVPMVFSW